MNYYEHHLGDYAEATYHLSFIEDAAYSRMIRKYYATEKPLPPELKAVQRLVGARTDEEREAVEAILGEFFELRSDGWHNDRCDDEIARYKDKQAKAKRSADARWAKDKTQSEGNAPDDANAMRTQSEGNAHQTPDARRQTPDVNPSLSDAHEADLPAAPTRKGIVCGLIRKAGMADAAPHYLTDKVWETILAKRTDEEIVEVAKAKMAAMPNQRIGLKYIAKALMDDPQPIAANARASPPGNRRQTAAEEREAVSIALTGRKPKNERPNATERDITAECVRIAG